MRFPLPEAGSDRCAITWTPPPLHGVRKQDLKTKGDVSEIEVWSVIAPSAGTGTASLDDMDWDALSWAMRPVRGELLGTLDLTARPNATTVEFACPVPAPAHGHGGGGRRASLMVELRCLRVACYVEFVQVPFWPKMGECCFVLVSGGCGCGADCACGRLRARAEAVMGSVEGLVYTEMNTPMNGMNRD